MSNDHSISRRFKRIVPITAAGLIVAAGIAIAGPLNPPAGPVAPTFKTLHEVEPRTAISLTNTPGDATSVFKITQPGSYYLTVDPGIVPAGKHGILIAASNVTIDLNGFQLRSLGNISNALDGVHAAAGTEEITVRNGSVHNMNGDGVDLSLATNCRVESVSSSLNNGGGVFVGIGSRVADCTATDNVISGILTGATSHVSGCVASGNNSFGIFAGQGSVITACTTFENSLAGLYASNGCTATDCTSSSNAAEGLLVGSACVVTDCSSIMNGTDGIACANGCTVTGSAARANGRDGIRFAVACLVLSNTCSINGASTGNGAGIHATGGDNRIEGNNCSNTDRGVLVEADGNIIIKNTCSGNSLNWEIAANNIYGPIVDRTAVSTIAVSGNTAITTLGSSDSNANFSY